MNLNILYLFPIDLYPSVNCDIKIESLKLSKWPRHKQTAWLFELPPERQLRVKWPVGTDGLGLEGAPINFSSEASPHSHSLSWELCKVYSMCVIVLMWRIAASMWLWVNLIPNNPKRLTFFGSVVCLSRTCLRWAFTITLRVPGLSAWHRWGLEPGPCSGWCRLATGHQWTAFAPSSLSPCFPFVAPSLSPAHSSLQVS